MSTPDELFKAATEVAAIAKDEPLVRAAISRHYYAAFHRSYDYHRRLPRLGTVGNAKGRHEQLINQLAFPDPKLSDDEKDQSVAVGKLLRLLCNKRVDSDYKMDIRLTVAELAKVVADTKTLFGATV